MLYDIQTKPDRIQVAATSIDQYIDSHPDIRPPDFIKIDAEDAELGILKGAAQIIQKYTPAITFETEYPTNPDKTKSRKCFEYLGARGYVFYYYDDKTQKIIQLDDFHQYKGTNILCVHLSKDHLVKK